MRDRRSPGSAGDEALAWRGGRPYPPGVDLRGRVERAETAVEAARGRIERLHREAANARAFVGGRKIGAIVVTSITLGLGAGVVVHNGAASPAAVAPPDAGGALQSCQDEIALYHGAWNDCRREQKDLQIVCQCPEDAPRCGCTP